MRYYNIVITKPPGSTFADGTTVRTYTSYPKVGTGNQVDPGALNVVLDAYVVSFATPAQLATVQIWGVALADVSQVSNFTDCLISVFAGFQKGLPLNVPAQAGLIISGKIFQSFANWQGTDMTLDFVIVANGAIAAQNNNIVLNWLAGTPLATALATTLKNAFPTLKQNIQINPNLVLNHDEPGQYPGMISFAQVLKQITQERIGGDYPGVDMVLTPDEIRVFDGSTQSAPTEIAFQDLIGQPTWLNAGTIQFVCPMRADLSVNDYVSLPKGILGSTANPYGSAGAVVTTSASQPQNRQKSVFSGVFQINLVHHMGTYRQASGDAWVTVFNANTPAGSTAATSQTSSASP